MRLMKLVLQEERKKHPTIFLKMQRNAMLHGKNHSIFMLGDESGE